MNLLGNASCALGTIREASLILDDIRRLWWLKRRWQHLWLFEQSWPRGPGTKHIIRKIIIYLPSLELSKIETWKLREVRIS